MSEEEFIYDSTRPKFELWQDIWKLKQRLHELEERVKQLETEKPKSFFEEK